MVNPLTYLKEVRTETTKVTWPSRQKTWDMTLMVLAVSIIVGAYLGLADLLFAKLLAAIL